MQGKPREGERRRRRIIRFVRRHLVEENRNGSRVTAVGGKRKENTTSRELSNRKSPFFYFSSLSSAASSLFSFGLTPVFISLGFFSLAALFICSTFQLAVSFHHLLCSRQSKTSINRLHAASTLPSS